MEWVEVTGTSVDAAKEAALAQLGVEADDAVFLIVSERTKGLFGRVRGEARVKAATVASAPVLVKAVGTVKDSNDRRRHLGMASARRAPHPKEIGTSRNEKGSNARSRRSERWQMA